MNGVSVRTALAAAALTAAVIAAFAGSPYAAQRATIDVDRLASAVAGEEDHVTALELAQWIRDRRPGLRVVDLRGQEEFGEFHLPGAVRIPIGALSRAPLRPAETIVLVSDGGAHAAQAWVFLAALGYPDVYFLRGGLGEWLDDVMNPTLAVDASPAEVAAFQEVSELSRYFGGTPRVTGSHTTKTGAHHVGPVTSEVRERRRGC